MGATDTRQGFELGCFNDGTFELSRDRSVCDFGLQRCCARRAKLHARKEVAMKHFELERGMLTLRGVFYPTGHIFVMYPTEQEARDAEKALERAGFDGGDISLLTPQEVLEKVAKTAGHPEEHLPSPGTEAATVQQYAGLARAGHWALLIHAPKPEQSARAVDVLKDSHASIAERYRQLVIEDIVESRG
jgi:hypothetical protein